MSANTNNWASPVQFHFSVVFKLPSGDTAAAKVKEIEDRVYLYNSELHRPSFVGVVYGHLMWCRLVHG